MKGEKGTGFGTGRRAVDWRETSHGLWQPCYPPAKWDPSVVYIPLRYYVGHLAGESKTSISGGRSILPLSRLFGGHGCECQDVVR